MAGFCSSMNHYRMQDGRGGVLAFEDSLIERHSYGVCVIVMLKVSWASIDLQAFGFTGD
jgi:hypothetical protein